MLTALVTDSVGFIGSFAYERFTIDGFRLLGPLKNPDPHAKRQLFLLQNLTRLRSLTRSRPSRQYLAQTYSQSAIERLDSLIRAVTRRLLECSKLDDSLLALFPRERQL